MLKWVIWNIFPPGARLAPLGKTFYRPISKMADHALEIYVKIVQFTLEIELKVGVNIAGAFSNPKFYEKPEFEVLTFVRPPC